MCSWNINVASKNYWARLNRNYYYAKFLEDMQTYLSFAVAPVSLFDLLIK